MVNFDRFPLFCVLLHAFQVTGKTNLSEFINKERKPPLQWLHMVISLFLSIRASAYEEVKLKLIFLKAECVKRSSGLHFLRALFVVVVSRKSR